MAATILQKEAPILRQVAKPVKLSDLGTPKFLGLVAELRAALQGEPDGVAIAAPQLGYSLRLFVVAATALGPNHQTDLVCVNPVIIKQAKQSKLLEEGCLSVRWIYGTVRRATKVSISAYDLAGKKFTYHGSGLMAQIFQHEIDHLNGRLFIDQATNLVEVKPPPPQL